MAPLHFKIVRQKVTILREDPDEKRVCSRVDTKFRDTKFREILHKKLIS
jgi:hypothetical protein